MPGRELGHDSAVEVGHRHRLEREAAPAPSDGADDEAVVDEVELDLEDCAVRHGIADVPSPRALT